LKSLAKFSSEHL